MTASAPGWYADPTGSVETYRWWDGDGWTRWLSDDPDAGEPESDSGQPPPAEPPAEPPAKPPAEPSAETSVPSGPQRPTVALPVAIALVVGVLVLAIVAIGAVVAYSADRLPSGPAVDPPAARPSGVIAYDLQTRRATVQEMHFDAPGEPFTCHDPTVQAGVFRSLFVCDADVHPDYDGAGTDWAATVAMGVLDDALVVAGDRGRSADRVFEALRSTYPTDATVEKRKLQKLTGISPEDKAVLLSLELHYRVDGVASRYDKIVIAVVELADGDHVTWFAAKPNDAAEQVGVLMDKSASSVTARR